MTDRNQQEKHTSINPSQNSCTQKLSTDKQEKNSNHGPLPWRNHTSNSTREMLTIQLNPSRNNGERRVFTTPILNTNFHENSSLSSGVDSHATATSTDTGESLEIEDMEVWAFVRKLQEVGCGSSKREVGKRTKEAIQKCILPFSKFVDWLHQPPKEWTDCQGIEESSGSLQRHWYQKQTMGASLGKPTENDQDPVSNIQVYKIPTDGKSTTT